MIQNPKSLPYVTWVTPNIRKKWKKKPHVLFYLFISWDDFETWILNVLEEQLPDFQSIQKTLKKSINLAFW